MATFHVEYSTTGRAKCKLKKCGLIINKEELRICQRTANDFFSEGGSSSDWYHASCFFLHMKRAKKYKLEDLKDLEGYEHLADSEQKLVQGLFTGKIEPLPFQQTPQYGQVPVAPSTPDKKSKKKIPDSFLQDDINNNSKTKTKTNNNDNANVKKSKPYVKINLWNDNVVTLKKKSNIIGRIDPNFEINDTYCAHKQIEISISNENIIFKVIGKNPTIYLPNGIKTKNNTKLLTTGQTIKVSDQDLFFLSLGKFPCTLNIIFPKSKKSQNQNKPKKEVQVNLSKKKKTASSEEEDKLLEDDDYDLNDSFIDNNPNPKIFEKKKKKKKVYYNESDDSDYEDLMQEAKQFIRQRDSEIRAGRLPPCQYGENCYRKNPDHFAQFYHPPKSTPKKKKSQDVPIAKKKSKLENQLNDEEEEINRAIELSKKSEKSEKENLIMEYAKNFPHLSMNTITEAIDHCKGNADDILEYLLAQD